MYCIPRCYVSKRGHNMKFRSSSWESLPQTSRSWKGVISWESQGAPPNATHPRKSGLIKGSWWLVISYPSWSLTWHHRQWKVTDKPNFGSRIVGSSKHPFFSGELLNLGGVNKVLLPRGWHWFGSPKKKSQEMEFWACPTFWGATYQMHLSGIRRTLLFWSPRKALPRRWIGVGWSWLHWHFCWCGSELEKIGEGYTTWN